MQQSYNHKKKIFIVITLGFLASVFTGCPGFLTEHVTFNDISIEGRDFLNQEDKENSYNPIYTSVFRNCINFLIYTNYKLVASNLSNGIGQSAYAWTTDLVYENEILDSTFSLSLSRPFVYAGDSVDADVDLFQYPATMDQLSVSIYAGGPKRIIDFSTVFFENSVFDTLDYVVSISCRTDDDLELGDDLSVRFLLE